MTVLEAALLADGVPRDKLYPLDVDRAFKKLEEIKPNITVWWTSGGQSAQLLHDGEVDMTMIWNGRASAVMKDDPDVAFTFNDGILQNTQLCILKNAPVAGIAGESAAVYRLRSGQSGRIQDRQDHRQTRGRIAERASECSEAGVAVGGLVGIGAWHSGEGALAQIHAVARP
jgi:hypothetical protein